MKSTTKIFSSVITGVAMASLVAAPAFACAPKGTIVKYVQDVTTGSQMVDANTAATALTVHPGDSLVYTIVIGNTAVSKDKSGIDDMIETKLSDTLPAGITGTTAVINEDLGNVKEGKTVTKTYTVKVTSTKDGDVITNKACYTGKSTDHNSKQDQAGCDVAVIKVVVPPTPTPPVTPPTTPTPPVTPPQVKAAAVELPNTGAGNLFLPAGIATGLGYVANLLRLKRRASQR